jgi:hypothetical protein
MYPNRAFLVILLLLGGTIIVATTWTSRANNLTRSETKRPHDTSGGKFIVHEWGTFTSFSGSNGVKLEFRPLADNDLPPFVLNRSTQSGIPNPFAKTDFRARQRMETPVTYFYTDQPRHVRVRVGFPQGLLTEFYPPVEKMQPKFEWFKNESMTNSELDWGDVWILPEDRIQVDATDSELATKMRERVLKRLVPRATDHEHYAYARETDSAMLYVERPADKDRPIAPAGTFFEKFLFYRGIGNFELPLKLTAHSDGHFEVANLGIDPLRSLFLVTVEGNGIRFVKFDELRGGEQCVLTQTPAESSSDELSEAVVKALVEEHLYEKEARAMVKTWRSSWFGEQGTRLFYVLPQTTTDKILPLTVEPKPDETIRVMVGRLEIMTPQEESRITDLVRQSVEARAEAAKNQVAYAVPKSIIDLGRLAEPALVRVQNITQSGAIQGEAAQLLRQLPR